MKSADEVIQEIDDMIEEAEGDEGRGGGSSAASAAAASIMPFSNCQRSSRMVSQALAGRRLEELSANELTQILSDIELLVRERWGFQDAMESGWHRVTRSLSP